MKRSRAFLAFAMALAACQTTTARVGADVQVGQAMMSVLLASEHDRECTLEDHLEALKTGVYNDCTFCQIATTDDVVAAVNEAVLKGPMPGPQERIFTYGIVPNLNIVTEVLIDSHGQSVVYYDFYVRGFDQELRQKERLNSDLNIIWSLSDEIMSMSKYEDYSSILQACPQ